MIQDRETGLWYREGTDDLKFLGIENLFRNQFPIIESDIVMEIGANIGDTTRWLLTKAKQIIAYEPLYSGVECIKKNAPKATVIQAGIGRGTHVRKVYYNPNHYSSASISLKSSKFQITDFYSFNDEIYKWKPTFIILDCEGAEWELIRHPMSIPDFVRIVAIEFHFHKYVKNYYAIKDSHAYNKIKRTQETGPPNVFGLGNPIWKYGFTKNRNISLGIWKNVL